MLRNYRREVASGSKGQALVEFALVAVVLLLFIFIIIEGGRLFQSWLTVQNSARAAGRYALTGKYETECLTVFPACLDPRVQSIKDEARRTAAGLSIDPDAIAGTPRSFIVEVWAPDEEGNLKPDYAGRAGDPVRVKVTYHMPFVVPFFTAIIKSVGVEGQVTITNEEFDQVTSSLTYTAPPSLGQGEPPPSPPIADLQISKNAQDSPPYPPHPQPSVYAGKALSWDVTVENLGPFDAEEIVVIDILPPGSTSITGTVSGGYCDPPDGETITCFLPNLAGDGGDASFGHATISTLAPKYPPDNPTIYTNTVTVSNGPATIDPYDTLNTGSATILVYPWADLLVSKTDEPDPVQLSKPLTYTIRVRNLGLNIAHNIVITDYLPVGVTYSQTVPIGICPNISGSPAVVVCNLESISPTHTYKFDIIVTSSITGYIKNRVTVIAEEDDLELGNNKATQWTRVVRDKADLEISKSSVPTIVNLGDLFDYEFEVYNREGDSALEIVVIDELPDEVSFVGSDPDWCSGLSVITCTIPITGPALESGDSVTFTVQVRAVLAGQDIENFASVSGAVFDPVSVNNTDVTTTSILQADLSVSKSGPSTVAPNEPFKYSIIVANSGPTYAKGVIVTDTLPVSISFVNDEHDLCTLNGQVARCDVGYLESGATVPINFEVRGVLTGTFTNTVVVTSTVPDPKTANNEDGATTIVVSADLEITKSSSPAYLGVPFTYTLEIINNGPSLSADIVVTDTLPVEVSYVSNNSGCTYYYPPVHAVICSVPNIDPLFSELIDITVVPTITGVISNTAAVAGGGHDSDPGNNSIEYPIDVGPAADLEISTFGPEQVDKDTWFTVTLTITNNGPSDVSLVTITNTITSDIDHVHDMISDYLGCTVFDSDMIVCTVVDEISTETPFVINIGIFRKSSGTYTNTAWVSGDEYDPVTTNDMGSIVINVQ